jgi:aspartyl protease family protein
VVVEAVRGIWIVPVRVNGAHPGRFMVDTGASVTIVSPALARAAGVAPGSAADAVELHTLGGRTVGTAVTLASIRVGDAEVRNAAAVVHDPGAGVDGILGNSFLGRYRVTLDADQRLLRLRSYARPSGGGAGRGPALPR